MLLQCVTANCVCTLQWHEQWIEMTMRPDRVAILTYSIALSFVLTPAQNFRTHFMSFGRFFSPFEHISFASSLSVNILCSSHDACALLHWVHNFGIENVSQQKCYAIRNWVLAQTLTHTRLVRAMWYEYFRTYARLLTATDYLLLWTLHRSDPNPHRVDIVRCAYRRTYAIVQWRGFTRKSIRFYCDCKFLN